MDGGDDNHAILYLIAERMEVGKERYGHGLRVDDGHDWAQEALEEALDLAVYVAARLVQLRRQDGPTITIHHQ